MTEKKILGLDISRNFAVGWLLTDMPPAPKNYFDSLPKKVYHRQKKRYSYSAQSVFLTNDSAGLKLFQALAPDVIVLEPTGYHYSHYWVMAAKKLGCAIRWVSHQALAKHRAHYGFKNKNDDIDALCLALTYLDPSLPDNRFMTHYDCDIAAKLRLSYFERKRLVRGNTANVNQIKQFLCIEHPEIAERDLTDCGKNGVNPTLGHIAGLFPNRKFPKENTGLGISDRTLSLVNETINLQDKLRREDGIISALLKEDIFAPYIRVFERYGFGPVISSGLLIKIYPLERFLDIEGKIVRDAKNRDLSLRHFQSYLGLSWAFSKSGDGSHQNGKTKKAWQGSKINRADLYMWVLDNICPAAIKPKSETMRELRDTFRSDRTHDYIKVKNGKPEKMTAVLPSYQSLGKDGICRFLFLVTRRLWRDLLEEVSKNP